MNLIVQTFDMDDDYTCMSCDGTEGEHVDDELICPVKEFLIENLT